MGKLEIFAGIVVDFQIAVAVAAGLLCAGLEIGRRFFEVVVGELYFAGSEATLRHDLVDMLLIDMLALCLGEIGLRPSRHGVI